MPREDRYIDELNMEEYFRHDDSQLVMNREERAVNFMDMDAWKKEGKIVDKGHAFYYVFQLRIGKRYKFVTGCFEREGCDKLKPETLTVILLNEWLKHTKSREVRLFVEDSIRQLPPLPKPRKRAAKV